MSKRKGQSTPIKTSWGLRAKAWWVLRKNRSMTLAELLLTLCDGTEGNAETNLGGWLRLLCNAGIVERKRETTGKRPVYRYTLINDLGPKAPVVRVKDGVVFDPNRGEVIGGES